MDRASFATFLFATWPSLSFLACTLGGLYRFEWVELSQEHYDLSAIAVGSSLIGGTGGTRCPAALVAVDATLSFIFLTIEGNIESSAFGSAGASDIHLTDLHALEKVHHCHSNLSPGWSRPHRTARPCLSIVCAAHTLYCGCWVFPVPQYSTALLCLSCDFAMHELSFERTCDIFYGARAIAACLRGH